MTSYEEKFKAFEHMIDSQKKVVKGSKSDKLHSSQEFESPSSVPTTVGYIKTVGFGEPTTSETPPIAIPNRESSPPFASFSPERKTPLKPRSPGSAPVRLDFQTNYKSKLSGWSDGSDVGAAPAPSSPKADRKGVDIKQSPVVQKASPTKDSKSPTGGSSKDLKGSGSGKDIKGVGSSKELKSGGSSKDLKGSGSSKDVKGGKDGKPNVQQEKVKGLSKAERKALYQQTAAAKQQQQHGTPPSQPAPATAQAPPPAKPKQQPQQPKPVVQFDTKKKSKLDKTRILHLLPSHKQVALFSHLPQYERGTSLKLDVGFSATGEIHPAILQLGLKYAQGVITGSNARCVALLEAFTAVIKDFPCPTGNLFRDLDIKPLVQFIVDCRPMSISMGNAINYLKLAILATKKMSEPEAKDYVCEKIEKFIQERIVVADEVISTYGVDKISDGDVILTYARSHVVEMICKDAYDAGRKFRVIVVDSRPMKEGKGLLERLVKHGIKCTYVLINAVSYIMKEVSKVFVGAYGMMANGNLISRVGTAGVAMMAHSYHVPFIVCCETYKFTERVQLESISFNELGDPDSLVSREDDLQEGADSLKSWKDIPSLKLLNLMYDLTPSEFIAMVITEVGMVPPTSVPAIVREYRLTV